MASWVSNFFYPTNFGFEDFKGFVSGNVDYFSHTDQAGYADWWHKKELVNDDGYSTDLMELNLLDNM